MTQLMVEFSPKTMHTAVWHIITRPVYCTMCTNLPTSIRGLRHMGLGHMRPMKMLRALHKTFLDYQNFTNGCQLLCSFVALFDLNRLSCSTNHCEITGFLTSILR